MTIPTALWSFAFAALVLTLTPGLDTVLVIRTRLAAGAAAGGVTAAGISAGCLIWGCAVALGLGAVLRAAPMVYDAVRIAGTLYLLVTGIGLIRRPRDQLDLGPAPTIGHARGPAFAQGLFTNLLNPKVGLFYLSFLPQFVPAGVAPAPFMALLALIHAAMGLAWFAALSYGIGTVEPVLRRPAVLRGLDRVTGGVFVLFGLKLAFDRG